ncbi:MAG: toll/interleukin-1 receptor domain-containing protein [Planctomycetota bacterium]
MATRKKVATRRERIDRPSATAHPSLELQRSPVGIYVGWHEKSPVGHVLARAIFRWFRGDPDDLERCATGIPVLYRCWDPGEDPEEIRILGSRGGPSLRVFVPLIDDYMAACTAWRRVIHEMTGAASASRSKGEFLLVLPVALHEGAFQIVGSISRLNFIRGQLTDRREGEADAEREDRRAQLVLDQLTDAIGRLIHADQSGFSIDQFRKSPAKISVFVSHAKSDGAAIAAEVRDELRRHGQLEAFYDESDLALGYDFAAGLEDGLGHNVALLVVLTDRYSSRPWCRHELRTMRRPTVVHVSGDGLRRVLRLKPVIVLDALGRRSIDHLPDIGPALVLRHGPLDGRTLTSEVMRHVLGYAHDLDRALAIASDPDLSDETPTFLINGPPDVRTVAEVRSLHPEGPIHILFPGPGVTQDAIEDCARLFPEVRVSRFDDVGVNR